MLEHAGWRRGPICDRAPAPFKIADLDADRVWYLKQGNKTVNVGYLLCLNLAAELAAHGVLEIAHFRTDAYDADLHAKLKKNAKKHPAIQFEEDPQIEDEPTALDAELDEPTALDAELEQLVEAGIAARAETDLENDMSEQLLPPRLPPAPPAPLAAPPLPAGPTGSRPLAAPEAPLVPLVPAPPAAPEAEELEVPLVPAPPAAPEAPPAPAPVAAEAPRASRARQKHVRVRRDPINWGPYQFTETQRRNGQRSWQAVCPYHGSRQRPCRKECPFSEEARDKDTALRLLKMWCIDGRQYAGYGEKTRLQHRRMDPKRMQLMEAHEIDKEKQTCIIEDKPTIKSRAA